MAYRCFIICVVLCLCKSLSTSDHEYESISIDCGSSVSYRDVDGIDWVGDDNYARSGEPRSVRASNSYSHVADTLRVFTTRSKSCYHIDSVKQGRVLVRATFYYGNYDGKNSAPTFALQFDGNKWWDEVETSTTEYYYKEVIYVMKRDSITVCVAQTKAGQFPFITALQVRRLESSMYRYIDNSYPLIGWRRVAFGLNTYVSYPDDPYDRIWWGPGYYDNRSTNVWSDARFRKQILSTDRPPTAVLKNAITTTTPNTTLELFMGFPSYKTRVYINFYFSEVTRLEPNQTRSFRIFKDNKMLSDPILPPYEGYVEVHINETTVSADTSFSLVPTNDSTLPPLINAMEIFVVGDHQLTNGTNNKDGLAYLQLHYRPSNLLEEEEEEPSRITVYRLDSVHRHTFCT